MGLGRQRPSGWDQIHMGEPFFRAFLNVYRKPSAIPVAAAEYAEMEIRLFCKVREWIIFKKEIPRPACETNL